MKKFLRDKRNRVIRVKDNHKSKEIRETLQEYYDDREISSRAAGKSISGPVRKYDDMRAKGVRPS